MSMQEEFAIVDQAAKIQRYEEDDEVKYVLGWIDGEAEISEETYQSIKQQVA